jgi:hypothetical protein
MFGCLCFEILLQIGNVIIKTLTTYIKPQHQVYILSCNPYSKRQLKTLENVIKHYQEFNLFDKLGKPNKWK